jgi:cellulose synthase/poly-beta-1,6-N-acetylglucosamine synthase-like glycosyltransferase
MTMNVLLILIFFLNAFIIFWAMIGYPLSIRIIGKRLTKTEPVKSESYEPTVTLMIVAHNEEKVISDKLKNAVKLNYPKDKLEILVASDNSTDNTNMIVKEFIQDNPEYNIRLYEAKERKGKTNAQNEAAAIVQNEVLVMTDANAMLDQDSIRELVSSFAEDDIAYVTGRLRYINEDESWTSSSESSYWEWDLKIREVESNLHSVTAGNGALYACRTNEYYNFDPIQCHDSAMPVHYVLQGKRAVYNKNAIAYEKAGSNVNDEFGRKTRMSRSILSSLIPNLRIFNIFKFGWFSYCYFGHRYCRRNLWLAHILAFLANILLVQVHYIFILSLGLQIVFYLLALAKHISKINNKLFNMVYYYSITIIAQVIGVYRQLTGKSKPFWDKAESTR